MPAGDYFAARAYGPADDRFAKAEMLMAERDSRFAISAGRRRPSPFQAYDGKTYSLEALRGTNGTLVMFICNHCPYVKAVIDRIVRDVDELRGLGIGAVAISSNDAVHYPEDSFDNMRRFAAGASLHLSLSL